MSPGETLAHYRVLDKLGQGGMGIVYRAIDTRLDRPVALKVISHAAGDAKDRARFGREAKAASALNHPNIVTIYEFSHSDGVDFIAMELIDGETLDAVLKRGPLSLDKVVQWASQVAGALAKAHSKGIIHRDLKPANLMVAEENLVKVLDFGLAKRIVGRDGQAETETALTMPGSVGGTPAFMSPEQAYGEEVDARSDVFSFGAILYQMTTGRRAFQGHRMLDVLQEVIHKEPESSRNLRPEAPEELHRLIDHCLAKDRKLRTLGMGGIHAALAEISPNTQRLSYSQRVPVPATVTLPMEPPKGPAPRRGAMLGWTAGVILAAVVVWLAVSAWINPGKTGTAMDLGGLSVRQLVAEGERLLGRAGSADQTESIERAEQAFKLAIGKDKASAMAYAGLAETYLRKYGEAPDEQWLRLATETARQGVKLNDHLAAAHLSLASALWRSGQREPAALEFRRTLELDPMHGMAHARHGSLLAQMGKLKEAETSLRKAIELWPRHHGPQLEYGVFLFRQNRYEEARAALDAALKLSPENAIIYRNLAAALQKLNRNDEAAVALQRALEIKPSSPVYRNFGTLVFFLGRYREAASAFERAIDSGANSYLTWGNLADAYRWTAGEEAKASQTYLRAIQLAQEALQRQPGDGEIVTSIGTYLAKSGKCREALAVMAGTEKNGNATGSTMYKLAVAQEVCGHRADAIRMLSRALEMGYSASEVRSDPEMVALRRDAAYHRLDSKR